MSWSSKRRFTYGSVIVLTILIVVGIPLFLTLHEPPTCFDGSKNGTELKVDCGGSCNHLCAEEVAPLVVRWSRAFPVTEGNYSAVAYVENPNTVAGVRTIRYRFELFDESNFLVAEREGETYLAPGGISPIFESNIDVGERTPTRTFFEFIQEPEWYRAADTRGSISIESRALSGTDTKPRLDATISNHSPIDDFTDVSVVAIIFGTDGNAIAASQTILPRLSPRESKNLVFTWPNAFGKRVEKCTTPSDVALLFDVSGSMNDDADDPPQPLTDAKAAASSFVARLGQNDRSGLFSFATNALVEHVLTFSHESVGRAIGDLSILPEEESGFTNMGAAIERARKEFISSPVAREDDAKARKITILLTDGLANAPETPGGEEFALEQAEQAKSESLIFYTIGLGEKVNGEFLTTIASSPEKYYQAASSKDLDSIYQSISEAICERGPAVIDILPRTQDAFLPIEL